MTRSFLIVASLLSALLCAAMLQGCGDATPSSAVGVYELDKAAMKASMQAEIDKIEDPMEKMGASMAMSFMDSMSMTIDLKADGTVEAVTNVPMGGTDSARGTWSMKGSAITFKMTHTDEGDPEEMTGTLKGGTLELTTPDEAEMPYNLVFNKKKA